METGGEEGKFLRVCATLLNLNKEVGGLLKMSSLGRGGRGDIAECPIQGKSCSPWVPRGGWAIGKKDCFSPHQPLLLHNSGVFLNITRVSHDIESRVLHLTFPY